MLLLEWRRARGSRAVPIASLSLGSAPQLSSEAAALPVLALCSATLCGLETFLPPPGCRPSGESAVCFPNPVAAHRDAFGVGRRGRPRCC